MVVSNTTVLLYFLKIRRIDLLRNYTGSIAIPHDVEEELVVAEPRYAPEIRQLQELLQEGFIRILPVSTITNFGLDKGENGALSLCRELKDSVFLSDDAGARKTARTLGFRVLGTIGVLLYNLQNKKITADEFVQLLHELVEKGFYLSTELYAGVIEKVNQEIKRNG